MQSQIGKLYTGILLMISSFMSFGELTKPKKTNLLPGVCQPTKHTSFATYASIAACVLCPCLVAFLLLKPVIRPNNTDPQKWQETTNKDLAFIYEQIKAHHPGPVDKENPAFKQNLEQYYKEALIEAKLVQNEDDYWKVIYAFVRKFNDSHLHIEKIEQKDISTPQIFYKELPYCELISTSTAFIRIPSFDLEASVAGTETALKEIITKMPLLKKLHTIIFDVHGNGGGNSNWGDKIAEALFSPDYVKQQAQLIPSMTVDYRVSAENIAHWRTVAQQSLSTFGNRSLYKWLNLLCIKMENALKNHEEIVRAPQDENVETTKEKTKFPDSVKAALIVIIDRHCFSATLDFIDRLKSLNHPITLWGETTGSDSLYMDIRLVTLPSYKGKLSIPLKVFRGRKRGNNEPYRPDVVYKGSLENRPALLADIKKWLARKKQSLEKETNEKMVC